MRYISNTPAQQREMLGTIGVGSIEDLLSRIPTKARLSRPLSVPAAMAESDLVRHLRRMAARNANADDFACFLGAGSYDHTVPSPINHLISRGEFFTAYTPYQPEASQGTLRSIYEYQTMICELTGMEVANASMYDGSTATAEAVLMAERPTPDAVFRRWTGGAGNPKPTLFFGAPTGYAGMLVSPSLPKRSEVALRLCSSAGEALPRELGERFSAHFGCELIDGIGSTEMLHIFLSNRPGDVHYGSTGKPVPGYTIELRGDDGHPVPDGEVGDLYIGGPSAALMYWGNRDKSRDTFQGAWTKSGDKYVRNANGTYTYSGRSDDMLKVSGIYVAPFEVEATLVQHPAVLEAAVIGKEDAEGLTKTKAFVVAKPGQAVSDTELKAFVRERLAPYKYPRAIEFLDELPKTATGKIQRFRLRERERGSAA
jgi:acyl-CoA synthetase (AMP-forming)/AMP-acid ligase II